MTNVYRSDIIAERRRFPRKPLNLMLKFELISSSQKTDASNDSQSENISANGLALYSEHQLEQGQEIALVLFLPPKEKRSADLVIPSWKETDCLPISIHAKIAWKLPFMNNKMAYGIEFISVDPKDQSAFDEFLDDFYLHKPNLI